MILLVGKNSFLAKNFLATTTLPVHAISHTEIDEISHWVDATCVVNFSFSPSFHTNLYMKGDDIDLRLARLAIRYGCHYVMLSSRRVYHEGIQWGSREDDQAQGVDVYGRNKLLIEQELIRCLGDNLTILRPGNVFGYELDQGRSRFGAFLLNQLAARGDIRLTINPFLRRDIVPVPFFCEALTQVLCQRPVGIFNVGAGEAIEVGKIAIWLLQGFGSGRLIVDSPADSDEFWLDSRKLKTELGQYCGLDRVATFSRAMGAQLRHELTATKE
jgi:dTDP-4-dehydrorhamnose reductase/UDP-glucose 4-epimerase